MKFVKDINGEKVEVEVNDEFTFNLYEREGFEKVEETEEKKKKKE